MPLPLLLFVLLTITAFTNQQTHYTHVQCAALTHQGLLARPSVPALAVLYAAAAAALRTAY
jgi:hypothetical protein